MGFLGAGGGAGVVDIPAMAVHEAPCLGLNSSAVLAAALDSKLPTKAFAVAARPGGGGVDLVSLFFMTNGGRDIKCKLRTRTPLDEVLAAAGAGPGPAGAAARYEVSSTPGYLFLSRDDHLFVFNTTRTGVDGPQFLFHEPLDAMARLAGLGGGGEPRPGGLMRCGAERHLLIAMDDGEGAGFVFVYDVELPLHAQQVFNPRNFTQPIMMFMIVVVGLYQFIRQRGGGRKDARR